MLPPKIKLHPLYGLQAPCRPANMAENVQDKIANLQQSLADLEEDQDRTSFYLAELTLWAANLRPKKS